MLSLLLPALLLATPAAARPAAPASANPLAPAAEGKVECYSPDMAKKTCKSMAGYQPATGGGYTNVAVILLSPSPPLVMQISSPVTVRDGKVCGQIRDQDLNSAQFQVSGGTVSPEDAVKVRSELRASMAAVIGKEICTQYLPSPTPGAKIARAIYDGTPRPEQDQTVIWITQSDGFRVAP